MALSPPADPSLTSREARLERVALPWRLSPAAGALLVRGDARPFALLGAWAGGGALVGSEPVRELSPDEDPFAALDDQPPVGAAVAGAVGGGWFGVLGFGLGRRLERLAPPPPRPVPRPDADLAFYDHLLRADGDGQWWFEALWTPEREDALAARLSLLQGRVASAPRPRPFATSPWRATPSPAGHAAAVAACRARIAEGDLFQANITLRLEASLDGDLLDLFATGVQALVPERAAFVGGPEGAVASLSPELFLARDGRDVVSAPIKGTRPRAADPRAAGAARDDLLASAKDRAENVMIVDLVRNDLGRVCVPGSIHVPALAEARAHVGVWHLVSEVAGRLRDDVGDGALVRAAFPPGSVTGAPKLAALDVIAELESTGREAYTGAIGFASPLAGLELNVAIRTFEARGQRVWLGVGGGVVADSDPEAEAAEGLAKAAPLLRAVGAAPLRETGGRALRSLRRSGPRPVPRPDPGAGVFETLLVAEGRAVAAEAHLARIDRSLRALYGTRLPTDTGARLAAAAHAARTVPGRARARLSFRPDREDPIEVELEPLPDGFGRTPSALRAVVLPGGLGPHKWRDRRRLDALSAEVAPAVALLVDLDGLVLEAAWGSVFAVDAAGTLHTPPLDGRILPGVTRARVLAAARGLGLPTSEAPLALAALHAAREGFLTSALRGVHPVAWVEGRALPAPGSTTRALAEALAAS